jgi:hypothetical protein
MSSATLLYAYVHGVSALLTMRCRPGTLQSSGANLLRACDGPGSAAHRFAPPRPMMVETFVYALALRRIRDTAPLC